MKRFAAKLFYGPEEPEDDVEEGVSSDKSDGDVLLGNYDDHLALLDVKLTEGKITLRFHHLNPFYGKQKSTFCVSWCCWWTHKYLRRLWTYSTPSSMPMSKK